MRRIAFLTLFLLSGCVTAPPSGTASLPAMSPSPATTEPAKAATPAVEGALPTVTPAAPVLHEASPRMLSLADFVDRNDENLLGVYPGMSRAAVERIMGSYRTGGGANPYKRQQIAVADGRSYEVLFYLTRKPRAGHRVSEGIMTPVIFESERVTAIGRYPLKKLRRAACQARGGTSCP